MHEEMRRDPERDPELERALRALGPEPPLDSVDWDALYRRIESRAELALARRRRSWWHVAAEWARPAVPAALAASLVLALLLPRAPGKSPSPVTPNEEGAMEDVLRAAALELPYGWIGFAEEADALLEAALLWEVGS